MTPSHSSTGPCPYPFISKAPPCYPPPLPTNSIPTPPPPPRSSTSSSQSTSHLEAEDGQTFTLFTHLPPELRLKIWSLTLPIPRLVPLTYVSSTSPLTPTTPKSHRGCTSIAAIPVTLHICQESRTLALQHYSLSFGLCGGISRPGGKAGALPSKIFFGGDRGDVLYFGEREGWNVGMRGLVNACMMVHPGPSGFGIVKRVAVHRGLFTGGKGSAEVNLRTFWERVRGKFGGCEEVMFVERGEDALLARKEREWQGQRETQMPMEGICHGDDGLGLGCGEEERFEEKIERVVRSLERETRWVAPRWRVIKPQRETQLEEIVGERQTTKEKEEALVVKMREMFGHEDVSNAV